MGAALRQFFSVLNEPQRHRRQVLGDETQTQAITRQPSSRLRLLAVAPHPPEADGAGDHFCVTDASQRFERIAGAFLGRRVTLELVDIGDSAAGSGTLLPERS